jgi:hypothetical protein
LAPINIFSEPCIVSNAFHKRMMTLSCSRLGEIMCVSQCDDDVLCAYDTFIYSLLLV